MLDEEHDIRRVGDIIYKAFEPRLSQGEGLVLMGHGNDTDDFPEANTRYERLNTYLQSLDNKIVIGTVDYEAMLYDVVEKHLHQALPAPAVLNLLPLMSVAGDHALNDLAGERNEDEELEEQSWMVRLQEDGYTINPQEHCHLHGLADYKEICQIWLEHLQEAEKQA